jgi:PAS domain S-box-containing protein
MMNIQAFKDEEQKASEAVVTAFKSGLGPFVVACETTRMPMAFTDAKVPGNPIVFANDAFLKLTGYERSEVLAQFFNFLLADDEEDDAVAGVLIADAFAGTQNDPEIRFRCKDGTPFYATILVSPVRDYAGAVVQHFISLVDTTRHHRARRHAAMLIDELNHRVKNTLATAQSIVTQALRTTTDPAIIRESIESRIAALSRSHDLLGHEQWQGAGLHDLMIKSLEPFSVADGCAERFTITGKNILLSPKAVLALGIAFHELATNAVKYGAFSNDTGVVGIQWTYDSQPSGDWLKLVWHERGGPEVRTPTRKGFGSRVLERGLSHEIGGTTRLDYLPQGLVCVLDFPLPPGQVDG